jgi:hypothetical protein
MQNSQLWLKLFLSKNNFFNVFLTSNVIANYSTSGELNQLRIENGKLTIMAEINSYKLISLNRFFNNSPLSIVNS